MKEILLISGLAVIVILLFAVLGGGDESETIEAVYGELSYHSHEASTLTLDPEEVWFNFTFSDGIGQGVTVDTANDRMIIDEAGVYKITFSVIGAGANNHEYHIAVMLNNEPIEKCENYKELQVGADITTLSSSCISLFNATDEIKLGIADYTDPSSNDYYGGNLNIFLIH